MFITSFVTLLALSGVSNAATIKNFKRNTISTTLFAYGAQTNGAPVFYADGKCSNSSNKHPPNNQLGLAYIG